MGVLFFQSTKGKNVKHVTYECEYILFLSSFQIWFPLLFSYFCGFYKLFFLNSLLVLTSFMHWHNPELGPKRTTDIIVLVINITVHFFFSLNISMFCFCISNIYIIVATTFYFVGKSLNKWDFSTFFHVFIHTFGVCAAITIYYFAREKEINAL